jgi:hypothetical protein
MIILWLYGAGMVVDGDSVAPDSLRSDTITPLSILELCNDGNSVTAVLDLNARDIYVLTEYEDVSNLSSSCIIIVLIL